MRSVLLSLALVATMATSAVANTATDKVADTAWQEPTAPEMTPVVIPEEAEEPKAEEPKAEEPKAEEPKAEEPKAEEPRAEEPRAEEPKAPVEEGAKPSFLAESRAVGEAARQAEKARLAALDREHPGPVPAAPPAPHEVRLDALQWASTEDLIKVLVAKVRCEADLAKGLLDDQGALRAHARLEALTRILEIRAKGLELTTSDKARIRALNEVVAEKARQGLLGAVPLETEGTCWTPIGVLTFYAQPGVKVDARIMRAMVDLLASAGVDLPVPTKSGTGWLGTSFRAKSAY